MCSANGRIVFAKITSSHFCSAWGRTMFNGISLFISNRRWAGRCFRYIHFWAPITKPQEVFGCLGSLGVYTRYLHYICDIFSDWRSVLFPTLESDYMFVLFQDKLWWLSFDLWLSFQKTCRQRGWWMDNVRWEDPKRLWCCPNAYLSRPETQFGWSIYLRKLVVCGYKCMGKRWFFVPPLKSNGWNPKSWRFAADYVPLQLGCFFLGGCFHMFSP